MSSKDKTPASNPTIEQIRYSSLTPRKTVTGGGTTKITDLRSHIGSEMDGEFVICDVDKFMEHYLPFVPNEKHIKSCVKTKLKPAGLMDKSKTSVFTAFPETPVINKAVVGRRTEMEIYASLEDIAKEIATYRFPDKSRTRNKFSYRNVPFDNIKSNIHGSNHKVDACFATDEAISEKDFRLSTWGMAVPVEQKVTTTDETKLDNNEKILSANVQIMNDDIRRMFTFGITIDGAQVTLWYHSRSHSAVSRSFDFVKDPERLISVFMSFLFATDVELGYDPMVERQNDSRHIFRIPQPDETSRFYRTVNLISGYRSNNITSRMPRVWVVESYDPDTQTAGAQFVLKDVWLEEKAETERQIQSAIFKNINEFGDGDPPSDSPELSTIWEERKDLIRSREYQQLFLKIEDDYVGNFISKKIASDSQPISGLFEHTKKDYTSTKTKTRSDAGPSSHPIQSAVREDMIRAYEPKKQYRVIFKEICRCVGELETLGEAMDVLQQAHTALQLLYCAGWVHRDISEGNILAHRTNIDDSSAPWKAKLMDLEYAKKFPPPDDYKAAADPKTGTPYFMPTEVLAKHYIFNPPVKTTVVTGSFFEKPQSQVKVNPPVRSIVVHNFQHDLESFWWLILWLIISHLKDQPSKGWEGPTTLKNAIKLCQNWAGPIFQNIDYLSGERRIAFYFSIEEYLLKFLPTNVAGYSWGLELLRRVMYSAYMTRGEKGDLRNKESYAEIHKHFGQFFSDLRKIKDQAWRGYVLKKALTHEPPKGDANPFISPPETGKSLPAPAKVKAKRGPDQNPNLEEQGRAGGSRGGSRGGSGGTGSKRSRRGR